VFSRFSEEKMSELEQCPKCNKYTIENDKIGCIKRCLNNSCLWQEYGDKKISKADWMITEDDIPNWDTLPPYCSQLVEVAEIAQKKLLKYWITAIKMRYAKYYSVGTQALLDDMELMLKQLESTNG
jgi:hypothetical protein